MKVTPPVKDTTKVYLVRRRTSTGKPEPYTVHMASSVPSWSYTMVLAFRDKVHAVWWGRSMEAYHLEHGAYPPSVYTKWPETMEWVRRRSAAAPLSSLEIAEMTVEEVMRMLAGSGIGCCVTLNPFKLSNKVDFRARYNRAATLSLLSCMLDRADM